MAHGQKNAGLWRRLFVSGNMLGFAWTRVQG